MNTSNITENVDSHSSYSTSVTVVIGMVMTLLSLLIVCGNALVIFVYVKNKTLQVPKNYYILSLAIADILVGMFPVNFYTVYLLTGYWPLGKVACDLWLSIDYSCCQASTLGLLAISVDRFLSIRKAVFYRNNFTKDRLKKIIVGLWLLSFLVWCGSVFLYPVIYGERTVGSGECYIQFLYESPTITIVTAFVAFYGPIIVMTIICICISVTLIQRYKDITYTSCNKQQQRHDSVTSNSNRLELQTSDSTLQVSEDLQSKHHKVIEKDPKSHDLESQFNLDLTVGCNGDGLAVTFSANTPDVLPSSGPLTLGKQSNKKQSTQTRKQYMAHKRAVILLVLVILAFAITWFPYNLLAVISPFCESCIAMPVWHFGYIFCYVNSLLNPFCYAFGNRHFKKCFKRVFQDFKNNAVRALQS